MDLWGDLLTSYGESSAGIDRAFSDLAEGLGRIGIGSVGTWLKDRLQGIVRTLGIEPVDLRQRKPVLTDSSLVASRAGMQDYAHIQGALRSIPAGATDPEAILQAVGYAVGERIMSMEFTIAEIPLPGGGSLPLTVRVSDIASIGGGGS